MYTVVLMWNNYYFNVLKLYATSTCDLIQVNSIPSSFTVGRFGFEK